MENFGEKGFYFLFLNIVNIYKESVRAGHIGVG